MLHQGRPLLSPVFPSSSLSLSSRLWFITMFTKFGSFSNRQNPPYLPLPLPSHGVLKHCQLPLISPRRITPVTGGCWVNTNAVFIPVSVWQRWEHRQLAASLVPGNYISSGIHWKATKCGLGELWDGGKLGGVGGGGGSVIRKLSEYWRCRSAWQAVN